MFPQSKEGGSLILRVEGIFVIFSPLSNAQVILCRKAFLSTHMSANFKKNSLRKKWKVNYLSGVVAEAWKNSVWKISLLLSANRRRTPDLSLVSFCHNEGWQFTLKILFSSFPGKQVKVKPTNCCWQVPYFCFLFSKLAIWVLYSICEWVSRFLDNRFE